MKYSIVIPTYNEAEIIEYSIDILSRYLADLKVAYEIIVVDNGSTDETVSLAESLAQQHTWLRVVSLAERGPGRAFVRGVKEASAEYVISLDADLSSELRFIDYAIDLLPHGDVVIGSKTMGSQQRSIFRIIASQSYILCTQILFGLTISDYSIGSKAYRKSAIEPFLDRLDPWTGYVFELCVCLRSRGNKIIQVGIECEDKRKSHFNLVHEGWYRYRHLFRVWLQRRESRSWLRGS